LERRGNKLDALKDWTHKPSKRRREKRVEIMSAMQVRVQVSRDSPKREEKAYTTAGEDKIKVELTPQIGPLSPGRVIRRNRRVESSKKEETFQKRGRSP